MKDELSKTGILLNGILEEISSSVKDNQKRYRGLFNVKGIREKISVGLEPVTVGKLQGKEGEVVSLRIGIGNYQGRMFFTDASAPA